MGQARKEARSALNWRFIIFNLLFSGTVFFGQIFSKDRNISTWAWIIGSGVMLASYIWIGIRKLGDRTA
jgi:purine-cytosine permease-like protein